jgi:hypothetical protein
MLTKRKRMVKEVLSGAAAWLSTPSSRMVRTRGSIFAAVYMTQTKPVFH